MTAVVIVRYGEIALKGGNRSHFERTLKRRVAEALRGQDHGQILRPHGRVLVRDPKEPVACAERAARVFGVTSASPATAVSPDLDAISGAAVREFSAARALWQRPLTWRVDARRVDKGFPLSSVELNAAVGERVAQEAVAAGPPSTVRLRGADVVVGIEVRPDEALVYARSFKGPGGLPLGVLGHGVALLSGGIDSPVAAWLAMKRGLRVSLLHFHAAPFVGDASREKVVDLARVLARWCAGVRLYVAPFEDLQVAIRKGAPENYRTILYRRAMNRVAARAAAAEDAGALITGESLGQVASQTVENLACIEDAADRLVLRPLLTYDKEETIRLAQQIGTYEASIRPHPDCCTLFQPRRPKIRGSVAEARAIEESLDLAPLVEDAWSRVERLVARESECDPA